MHSQTAPALFVINKMEPDLDICSPFHTTSFEEQVKHFENVA